MFEIKACTVSEKRQPAGETGSPDGYRDEFFRNKPAAYRTGRRNAAIGHYGQTLFNSQFEPA